MLRCVICPAATNNYFINNGGERPLPFPPITCASASIRRQLHMPLCVSARRQNLHIGREPVS